MLRGLRPFLVIALLALAACKATGGDVTGDVSSAAGADVGGGKAWTAETPIACVVSDGAQPRYELRIEPQGFDPERGSMVTVLLRASGEERAANGFGSIEDSGVELLFETGQLSAPATRPGHVFVGKLELDGDQARSIRCER